MALYLVRRWGRMPECLTQTSTPTIVISFTWTGVVSGDQELGCG